jgi:hypothetical protein
VLGSQVNSSPFRIVAFALTVITSIVVATPARAQSQRQPELHANFSRTTQTKTNSWGAGTQLQLVWGASSAPVLLGTSFGADYLKQEGGGPSQWNASMDAVLQPGGNSAVTPYAGGSVGSNWSTGDGAQWSGARLGLEVIGGAQVKLGPGTHVPTIKAEERFGYVNGQEHTLATRIGFAVSF